MEVREGYKQTEMGIIPEDWDAVPIRSACTLINGRGFKPHEWQTTGLPIIRIQNLNGSEEFNYYTGQYNKKIEVEPGQLLFAWSGSRGTSFGPHVWPGPLGLLNYHTWKVQVKESAIVKSYFLHALKQLTAFIEDKAHGASALVHTQKWEMEGFLFLLPPTKAEQEAIAEALSDADGFIESLEQLITKKRQIKQGAMQELFSRKQSDDASLLRQVSTLKGRIGWQGLKQTEFNDNTDDPFLITGMNFKDGAIRWDEVYHIPESRYAVAKEIQLRPNDVLMTKDGTIGKILFVDEIPYPGKATLNSHLLLFRPIGKSYYPKYLYYQLCSQRFKDFIEENKSGTTFSEYLKQLSATIQPCCLR